MLLSDFFHFHSSFVIRINSQPLIQRSTCYKWVLTIIIVRRKKPEKLLEIFLLLNTLKLNYIYNCSNRNAVNGKPNQEKGTSKHKSWRHFSTKYQEWKRNLGRKICVFHRVSIQSNAISFKQFIYHEKNVSCSKIKLSKPRTYNKS